jgi:hypothetical protein
MISNLMEERFTHSVAYLGLFSLLFVFIVFSQRKRVETLAQVQVLRGHLTSDMVGTLPNADPQIVARANLHVPHIDTEVRHCFLRKCYQSKDFFFLLFGEYAAVWRGVVCILTAICDCLRFFFIFLQTDPLDFDPEQPAAKRQRQLTEQQRVRVCVCVL